MTGTEKAAGAVEMYRGRVIYHRPSNPRPWSYSCQSGSRWHVTRGECLAAIDSDEEYAAAEGLFDVLYEHRGTSYCLARAATRERAAAIVADCEQEREEALEEGVDPPWSRLRVQPASRRIV